MIKFLAYALMLEIMLGGGGRFYGEFSETITFRILLFFSVLPLTCFYLFLSTTPVKVFYIWLSFLIYLSLYSTLGLANGYEPQNIVSDLRLYFPLLIFPFFFYSAKYFNDKFDVFLRCSALILIISFYIGYYLLATEIIPFEVFYIINNTGEFFFRGQTSFVYKGFLFIFLAIPLFMDRRYGFTYIVLALFSAFLMESRGFLLTGLAGVILTIVVKRDVFERIILLTISIFGIMASIIFSEFFIKIDSDFVRYADIDYVLARLDFYSWLFGKGFGVQINGDLVIEFAYLQLLYKTGLVGLLFFLAPCLVSISKIICSTRVHVSHIVLVLIYFQSIFNPYVTNPIGMTIVCWIIGFWIWSFYRQNQGITNVLSNSNLQYKA
ncbi:hypothetical protein N9I89_02300 [Porticoccaceae bacterium]|nr:hypothetical protein [Porticoccaceae bacterium]MDA8898568.1 hypothetical protein [Porticoccaceae bacterium]